MPVCCTIIERLHGRSAMMREIARKRGNFRGVCPTIGRLRDSGTAYIAANGQNRPALRRFSSCRGVIRTKACTENLSPYEEPQEQDCGKQQPLRDRTADRPPVHQSSTSYDLRRKSNMAAQKEMIRIRLKAYDHQLIDQAAEKIVDTSPSFAPSTSTRTAVSSSSAAPTSA